MSGDSTLNLLKQFSERRGTPYVDKMQFMNEMIAIAFSKRKEKSDWGEWLSHPKEKLTKEIDALIANEQISKKKFDNKEYIFIPEYYIMITGALWNAAGSNAQAPFPSESQIPYPVPAELVQIVTMLNFNKLLDNPPASNLPLLRLAVGENGSIITLASFLRTKVLYGALIRIKAFISEPRYVEYIRKEMYRFIAGSESFIEASFNSLRKNIAEPAKELENNNDNTYRFWISMCKLIRNFPHEAGHTLNKAVPFLQAADIVEIYNAYYHQKKLNETGEDSIIGQIEHQMAKPPYFFTLEQISQFTGKYGKPFAETVPSNEFAAILQKRAQTWENGKIPPLLGFTGKKERFYTLKKTLYTGVLYRAGKIRKELNDSIRADWLNLMRDYRRANAMINDADFDSLILQKLKDSDPFLAAVYLDGRLTTLKKEMAEMNVTTGEANALFESGYNIIPIRKLLKLERRLVLALARNGLPFWYHIPFIVSFIRLLRWGGTKENT